MRIRVPPLRLAAALLVAVISDVVAWPLEIAVPLTIALDVATAAALWALMGRSGWLIGVLLAEAVPGVGLVPLWTMVVVGLAFLGRLPGRSAPQLKP